MQAILPMLALNTGVQMPALGLGVYQSTPSETVRAVETAIARGYRLIDTAATYGNESDVGEGIRRSGIDRSHIFVTTKLWISDYGFEQALRALDASVQRLGLEYIDLYLLHWPVPSDFERTITAYKAIEKAFVDGKVRAIGVSNFKPEHFHALLAQTDIPPAVNQVELHPYFTQAAVCDADTIHGIITQSWSPLGGVQRYRAQDPSQVQNVLTDPLIREIAETYTKTPAQIVLRWHLQHGLSAIPKSTQPERIAQNIDLFDFRLSSQDMARIDNLNSDTRSGQDPDRVDTKLFPFTTQDVIQALRVQRA